MPSARYRLNRIEHQIQQDFFESASHVAIYRPIAVQNAGAFDPTVTSFGTSERQYPVNDFTQAGGRRRHCPRPRKTQELGHTAAQSVYLTGDQVEVASVLEADFVIFTHHLGDRLDRAQRISDL